MKQWEKDYTKMLLDATGYSGNKEPGKKKISSSSLTSNTLELYLDYKFGKKEDEKFEASNMGSMFQLGIDKACEGSKQYISAERIDYELSNGWTLSGEIDQRDIINKVIIDNKLSTATALKKVKSENLRHNYAVQLGAYKFLIWKKYNDDEYIGALAFNDKTASYFKPTSGPTLNLLEVPTYDFETIEAMAVERTNELQWYIDNKEEPPVCEDRFPYKSKGGTINMKCRYYCNFNEHCKHYNEYSNDRKSLLALEPTEQVEDFDEISKNLKF
jgi:hypothetical protein